MNLPQPVLNDEGKPICGAKGRSGKPCGRPAGAGTEHLGFGHCKHHTGSTPNGETHAAKLQVTALAAALGDGFESADAYETIMLAIRRANAEVALFGQYAPEGSPFVNTMWGPKLHAAWAERQAAQERAVQYAKTAIQLGLSERQVRVAEQMGAQIGGLVQEIVTQLGLTTEQKRRLPDVIDAVMLAETSVPAVG